MAGNFFLLKYFTLQELVLTQKLHSKTPALISSSMLAGIFAHMFTEFISERFEVPLPTRKDFLVDEVTFFFEIL